MRTIVYGNGKSECGLDVNEKLDNVVTWGCNRIQRLTIVDFIYKHGPYIYAMKNIGVGQIG